MHDAPSSYPAPSWGATHPFIHQHREALTMAGMRDYSDAELDLVRKS
jgi:hypothetical protein